MAFTERMAMSRAEGQSTGLMKKAGKLVSRHGHRTKDMVLIVAEQKAAMSLLSTGSTGKGRLGGGICRRRKPAELTVGTAPSLRGNVCHRSSRKDGR